MSSQVKYWSLLYNEFHDHEIEANSILPWPMVVVVVVVVQRQVSK
jgi:hypothetical protein